jgi:hypothetical protein
LHQRQVVAELKYAGVLRPLHPRDDSGMRAERQAGQGFSEVRRTYLAGSTRAVDGLGKTEFFLIGHSHLLRSILLRKLKNNQ